MMIRVLLLFILFLGCIVKAASQTGYLFIKKGAKKKKEYLEGDRIFLRLSDGMVRTGVITRLMNDTIYLSGRPVPVAVESFHALKERQRSESAAGAEALRGRVNLLNWDGNGAPPGLFPPRSTIGERERDGESDRGGAS